MAPLRALDWRFLLPVPPDTRFRRLALLGAPRGLPELADRVGLASEVVTTVTSGAADVVAAWVGSPASIAEIAASVAADGVLYLQVDRAAGVRVTRPSIIEGVLRDAGLHPSAIYALEPDANDPRAYIALDTARAMNWHRLTALGPHQSIRLANVVRQSAVRFGGASLAAWDRPFAIVAVRGDPGDAATPGVLSDMEVLNILGRSSEPRGAVMITYGGDRVLFFPFFRDEAQPAAVLKLPKTPRLIGRTENEQAQMRTLRDSLDSALGASIPRPLGTRRWATTVAACEQYRPGMSLAARASDERLPIAERGSDLSRAMDWLIRFHLATERHRSTIATEWSTIIERPLDAYRRSMGLAADDALSQAVRDAGDALGDVELATVTAHRDFAAWNVIRDGDALAVVDWEGAREGHGAFDALHLATTWLYAVRLAAGTPDELRCVLDLIDTNRAGDLASTVARDAISRYAAAVRLDRRAIPLLMVLHRVELAVRRNEQHRLQATSAEAPENDDARIVRALGSRAGTLLPKRPS